MSIARALANDPDVLFADEPTGNLDSKSGEVVLGALQQAAAERQTVILVTHDSRWSGNVGRIIELEDGVLAKDARLNPATL